MAKEQIAVAELVLNMIDPWKDRRYTGRLFPTETGFSV